MNETITLALLGTIAFVTGFAVMYLTLTFRRMRVVCAWCKRILRIGGLRAFWPGAPVSHGICKACDKQLNRVREPGFNPLNNSDQMSWKTVWTFGLWLEWQCRPLPAKWPDRENKSVLAASKDLARTDTF